jgi:TetR/AcrR family transcriptional regulator, transcriptional repressor for nem operon
MRVSKEQAAKNRQAIVDAASTLFRERGVDGVGVADLMKAAGFTHGGFYNHFPSKEALAAEACASAFSGSIATLREALEEGDGAAALADFVQGYLTPAHRDDSTGACPTASMPIDAWRQGEPIQVAYAEGLSALADLFTANQPAKRGADGRARALRTLSEMVGALVLARAVAEAAPALSDELLAASRSGLAGDR